MSVLQPWVEDISMMQQSVLMIAMRGPDGLHKDHISKDIIRWLRRSFTICAFEKIIHTGMKEPCTGLFMGPMKCDTSTVVANYFNATDEIPHHFQLHLIHAAEILGYKHPNSVIRHWWHHFYLRAVRDMHMFPENEAGLDYRLGDNEEHWRKGEER